MNIRADDEAGPADAGAAAEADGGLRVEATAGGGMVTVVVNGTKQILSIRIDPEVVSKDDVEMLQDLILAAVNDAQRKVDEELQKHGRNAGGMIPGMF